MLCCNSGDPNSIWGQYVIDKVMAWRQVFPGLLWFSWSIHYVYSTEIIMDLKFSCFEHWLLELFKGSTSTKVIQERHNQIFLEIYRTISSNLCSFDLGGLLVCTSISHRWFCIYQYNLCTCKKNCVWKLRVRYVNTAF
jgi:hypothetical protein